jgi:polyisoprenyl-phosphate glycosyltransferase
VTRNLLPALNIIIPCYNEEEVIHSSFSKLSLILEHLIERGLCNPYTSKLVFVDDGSTDGTYLELSRIASRLPSVYLIKLSRNFGHQAALLAGLEYALKNADFTITIDADLQDDPQVIFEMATLFSRGYQVVYGVRSSRHTDTYLKSLFAKLFYKMMLGLGLAIVYNHADFRMLSKRAIKALSQYHERSLFLRGVIPLLGFRSTRVYYDRLSREAGTSKYPFRKSLSLALDGLFSLSVRPIRLVTLTGFLCIFASIPLILWLTFLYATGVAVQGWTSIMMLVVLTGGIQLLSLGVIGEYIGRIYKEVKKRPHYHLDSNAPSE